MVGKRVLAALLVAAVVGGALYGDYLLGVDLLYNMVMVAVTVLALREFYRMCEAVKMTPFRTFGTVSAVLLVALNWLSLPGTMEWMGLGAGSWAMRARVDLVPVGIVVAILGAFWSQATKRDNAKAFESISSTLLGVMYVWFLPSFMVRLRHLGSTGELGGGDWVTTGTWLVVLCTCVSKISDVGAFFTGRHLGRHKLITRISPNKTWEGACGGLLAGVAMAVILGGFVLPQSVDIWRRIVFGVFVGGLGQFGDLAESLLKRAGGIKDAGGIVPGFGGTLDLVDSLMISAPVGYVIAAMMLGGGQ